MDAGAIIAIISAASGITGIVLGWIGRSRTARQDVAADATADATLRADVSHIRHSVDDVRVELRAQGQRYDALAERVTRVEESTKSAHRRIDRHEKGGND